MTGGAGTYFRHLHSAHCESGTTAALLTHHGIPVSEALAFGLGEGLFFGYFPFFKVDNLPLLSFRSFPGSIFRKATGRVGAAFVERTFREEGAGMDALDRALDEGRAVGVQAGVFWLPYFPPALRFHFNGHHLVVHGRDGEEYLVSDPTIDSPVRCTRKELGRARFSQGPLAPRGRMFYLTSGGPPPDLAPAVRRSLAGTSRRMTRIPFPLIGVRGIRFFARRVARLDRGRDRFAALLHLGHFVRMQEEIGTGGGGFRFLFAAFLQEAAGITGSARLGELSGQATAVGDRWREVALAESRICKSKDPSPRALAGLAELILGCAEGEERLHRGIGQAVRG